MARLYGWIGLGLVCLMLQSCGKKQEELMWRAPSGTSTGSTGGGSDPAGNQPGGVTTQPPPAPKPSYLDNGIVRIGVDLNRGGAIAYLAPANGKNMINTLDLGRFLQPSYYAGPIPFVGSGQAPSSAYPNWSWNPVLAGDAFGITSDVKLYQNTGNYLYVKTVPMVWSLSNEPCECDIETWIELKNNLIKVRHRLNNNRKDKTQYAALAQERPAIFTERAYSKVMTYTGSRPFTNDALSDVSFQHQPPNSLIFNRDFSASENWAAIVNDANWGLGIWTPNQHYYITSIHGTGRLDDGSATYLTPSTYDILDHNIQYDYEYTLIVGSLSEIRQFVYNQPRPAAGPTYRFTTDRQHWWYYQGADAGWPIQNELNLKLDKGNFLMIGPEGFWQAADVPRLYIRAAFKTDARQARLRWKSPGDPEFIAERTLDFAITGDGTYRTYELDMTKASGWRGIVKQLALEPALNEKGGTGKYAKIQSITTTP